MALTALSKRLDKIEQAAGREEGWRPWDTGARDAEIEDTLRGLGISTTPAEAEAKGFSCVMEEIAAALGYTGKEAFQQFNRDLEQKSDDWYSRHEFRWVGERFPKQCQIRERR